MEPTDQELRDIVSRLELSEKALLLAGQNVWETVPIERLGIPSLKVTDGPNGARGGNFFEGTTAACFPACVSLAATFNRDLSRRVGKALGQEAQTKGAYVLLGPTVCCHRSPLGGRNFEAFSEDPLLSGQLAAEYVKGLQSERVGATVKHFVANEQDTRRFSVNETISERALREIYLRPFEIVVKEADPWCLMSSYPKVNGAHVDAQPRFIRDILRGQWGYQGLVMSDWGAVSNTADSIKYGLDLEMPGPPRWRTPDAVQKAFSEGQIRLEDVDDRVLSLLKLLRRSGKFTDRKVTPPEKALDLPEHRALIRGAGAEGIVLLKNQDAILPLDTKSTRKVALLGPLAKYAAAHGGGSASLNCHYKVSPYDAFQERLGKDVDITYSQGAHIFRVYPDLEKGTSSKDGSQGFTAEFFKSSDFSGNSICTKQYPRGFFTTLMDTEVTGATSVRFSTTYTPPESGKHYLSFSGIGPSKLYIDKKLVGHQERETRDSMAFFLGVQDEKRFQYDFSSSRSYEIVIETGPSAVTNSELFLMDGNISAHIGLVTQAEMEQDLQAEAVALAAEADVAICFVGNTTQWETEGQDLASMTLPADGSQDRLVAAVAKANPNTIVVNATGVPVELPWLNDVAALVQIWYAGQESGNSILDVLLGEVSPSGKLPISWPKKYEHTGCYGHFGLDSYESREVEYVEGVFVGYRHFDRLYCTEKEVLFPFGFGLSYTEFDITNGKISGTLGSKAGTIQITATVTNTGKRAGAEVIQLYLAAPMTDRQVSDTRPPKSLVAFTKVALQPGASEVVTLKFGSSDAAYWDDQPKEGTGQCWRVDAGSYAVSVATSSRPADAKTKLNFDVTESFTFDP